ncbi:streptogrisin C [Micromonospora pattaloongensis]|uniref:Streptogrisin C n=1 Tax=Micromonospora pattaloongensis TaxID=405436 RepID=A0A1H3KH40_9ACTN|nr:S1 family peptidase [Micromonospora pattaloongensis]SDY51467.1 streptogrisin C [Micromonospora pattaloongensis]
MQRRRAIAGAVMLATVGAAAAVTIPAVADDGPGRDRRPAAAPAGGAAPEMVDALRRDLRLTADQARSRLAKEEWARRTAGQLRADLGGGFGGSWLTADGRQLMVAVTDPAAAERVRATGAEPKLVARSERQLDTVKRSLDRNAGNATPDMSGWYVDVADNSVVVLAQPGAEPAARRFATASGVPAGSVRVETSTAVPVPLFDVIGGDPYFIDGRARCSIGFSVVGGFVTAGHCGAVGATTTGFNQAPQGTVRASSFPGDDWGVVEVNGDWTPRPVVKNFNGGEVAVAGAQEAPIGASICRSGSTTGTRCGVIQAKNVTVNYPEGAVGGLTQTNVCAEGGDSGGSWISGDQAQGVTSGGSGNCTVGGTTFFQPLAEILQRNNLTLVTTGSAGEQPPAAAPTPSVPSEPAPTDPPSEAPETPAGCDNPDAVRSGNLARAGSAQIQPNGRYFRARAGDHTACLDAPQGADFDLVLQRWNGSAWRTVAASSGERLTHSGDAGFYRYRVQSQSGAGRYTLAFSVD